MDSAAKTNDLGIDFQSIALFEDALQIRNVAKIVKTLNYENLVKTLETSGEDRSGVFSRLLEATIEYYKKIEEIEESQA